MKTRLLLLLIIPFFGAAQTSTLCVNTKDVDGLPIANIQIFFDGTSIGGKSDQSGKACFNLTNGNYTLVANNRDYEKLEQQIVLQENQTIDINLELFTELEELVVKSYDKANWKYNFEQFKNNFLGTSNNRKACTIKNPRNIKFRFENQQLRAFARDPIVIENKSLGYVLSYDLNEFVLDYKQRTSIYSGVSFYQELKANKRRKQKQINKRKETYFGSVQHFVRALYNNDRENQGFSIMKILRKPNPERPSQEQLDSARQSLRLTGAKIVLDSNNPTFQFLQKAKLPKYKDYLINQELKRSQYIQETDNNVVLNYKLPNHLSVEYTPTNEVNRILVTEPTNLFPNGNFSPLGIYIVQGEWQIEKVCDMLPLDYTPEN